MSLGSSSTLTTVKCCYCGSYHYDQICPRIKSIEYHENGTIKKVELIGEEKLLEKYQTLKLFCTTLI